MANNWTRGAAYRHTTAPISALGLHPVDRELLLISRPAEGRRLSWPELVYRPLSRLADNFTAGLAQIVA